ncbi:MAG: hypothetical protein HY998_00750 [candidate division NC10 bacterium]|nr:hypothetical protein [candidate division NC10 bacterium]
MSIDGGTDLSLYKRVREVGCGKEDTYGLDHCRDFRCVMFFSNSLLDTDRKGPGFCPRCQKIRKE